MNVVFFRHTCPVRQVEIPETRGERRAERSVTGALHVAPGSTKNVTDDELHFLEQETVLKGQFQVVHRDAPPAPPPPAKPAPAAPEHTPEATSASSTEPAMGDQDAPRSPTPAKPAGKRGDK